MTRRAASLLCVVAVVAGFAVGRSGKREVSAAPATEPEAVAEISISHPDPSSPTGFAVARYRVTHSGTNAKPAGRQEPGESGVVLWYPQIEGQTRQSAHYYGVPTSR